MKKAVFCVVLALLLIFAASVPFLAVSGLFSYEIRDGHAIIQSYTGFLRRVTIPETLGGYPVTEIASYAFEYTDVSEVKIPASVEKIGIRAFEKCMSLESLTVAEGNPSYRSVDGVLFCADGTELIRYPQAKSGAYTVPDGVTSLAAYAFSDCTVMTQIKLPATLVSVGDYAFSGCRFSSVTLPSSLHILSDGAFYRCSSLTGILLPAGISYVGLYAFYGCTSLADISVIGSNETFSSLDGVLYNKERTVLLCCPEGRSGSLEIPDTVTELGYQALMNASRLTAVTFPETLTTVGAGAFSGCSSLEELILPSSVTEIGEFAFAGCEALERLTLPSSITEIPFAMCSGCEMLTAIRIPDSVVRIRNYAFSECPSLQYVVFSSASMLDTLGRYVFRNDVSLRTVALPETLTEIGMYAFSGCSGLQTMYIPASVSVLGNYSFVGCSSLEYLAVTDGTTVFGYPLLTSGTSTKIYCLSKSSPVYSYAVTRGYAVEVKTSLEDYRPKLSADPEIPAEVNPVYANTGSSDPGLKALGSAAVQIVFDAVAHARTLPPAWEKEADLDGDGLLTLNDVILMDRLFAED